MSLETYHEKRRFDETPEPRGEDRRDDGPLRFVVQKHRASHLHYDFRLEMDGVLKSWAVPKGPSTNPKDKRLAMMVEDHPLDYGTFEGTIPEGNYGAGTVMVWDHGVYLPRRTGASRAENERILRAELHRGHLTFVLEGTKLHGEYALVKLQRGEPNAWLLVKKDDTYASDADVREEDRSAASARTMDEIASATGPAGGTASSPAPAPVEIDLSEFPEAPMPREVTPMLAVTGAEPFDRPGWLFEIKWDGYRAIAEIEGGEVRLYSRTNLPFNKRFATIVHSLERLGRRAVLDGEVVALDEAGKPRFQLLHNGESTTLVYYVFDLLYLDGHDLRRAPLWRRKDILKAILPAMPNIKLSEHVEQQGRSFFAAAAAQGLEGILAKNAESPYMAGRRTDAWVKVKTGLRQDAVIAGFTAPRGTRESLGALVLGVYEGNELKYVGHVGTGFDRQLLVSLRARLEPLVVDASPFYPQPATNAPVHWVRPEVVCTVRFTEWTAGGSMRHPVFLGLREDVPPRSVCREKERSVEVAEKRRTFRLLKKGDEAVEIDGQALKLTNLDKLYWPEDRLTKRDLVEYYRTVAPIILPYLRDRPESLHRHPNGIEEESFFQKDVPHPPAWLETVDVLSESEDREITYLVCGNEATLVYMANLACIELNPWNSRAGSLDRPDYLVIDLDPEAVPFARVVEAALAVRRVLEEGGIESLCKTSGATGLHIYVPLGARYTYEQARGLAQLIATLAHHRLPEWTSLERSPSRRQGKVYLDYLQNRHGQTLVAPYSLRPRKGAPVSTPLHWEEVGPALDPSHFTIHTILGRLDAMGDLWKPVLGPGIDLAAVLDTLGGRARAS